MLLVATFSSAVETETRRHRRDRLEAAWGVPPGKIVRARGAAAALRTAPGRTAVAHEAIDVADIAKRSARHSTRALVCVRVHLGLNVRRRATNVASGWELG